MLPVLTRRPPASAVNTLVVRADLAGRGRRGSARPGSAAGRAICGAPRPACGRCDPHRWSDRRDPRSGAAHRRTRRPCDDWPARPGARLRLLDNSSGSSARPRTFRGQSARSSWISSVCTGCASASRRSSAGDRSRRAPPGAREADRDRRLRKFLEDLFARRADVLKAANALADLDRLAVAAADEDAEWLGRGVERVRLDPGMRPLATTWAFAQVAAHSTDLPDDLEVDLRRVALSGDPAQMLGLPAESDVGAVRAAAAHGSDRWRRFANESGGPEQQRIADVMCQQDAALWQLAGERVEGPGVRRRPSRAGTRNERERALLAELCVDLHDRVPSEAARQAAHWAEAGGDRNRYGRRPVLRSRGSRGSGSRGYG